MTRAKGDDPCSGPDATHSLACACRERAFAELRAAAQEILERFAQEAMRPDILDGYPTPEIERLRKALEATR